MNQRVLQAGCFEIEEEVDDRAWPGAGELTWAEILDEDALSHLRRIIIILVVSVIWISFSSGPPAPHSVPEGVKGTAVKERGSETTQPDRLPATRETKPEAPERPSTSRQTSIGETSFERRLLIPVVGVASRELLDTFHDKRGPSRTHQAIDIMAAARTPVVAADDGIISRMVTEPGGGIALYQKDPTSRYVYYYAHLHEYASGIEEGREVGKGELLGYVGSTGNARTPHLHFAVHLRGNGVRWWKGEAINPYPLLVESDLG